jgi:RNA recognition motif-containing protein
MSQTQEKKLYVGSLPYSTTEDALRELFSPFGEVVSVHIISDKFTGQSKGFGFVEMATAEEARRAVAELHEKPFQGRTLLVNHARPQQKRERSFGSGEKRDRWGGGNSEGGSRFRSSRYNNSY